MRYWTVTGSKLEDIKIKVMAPSKVTSRFIKRLMARRERQKNHVQTTT